MIKVKIFNDGITLSTKMIFFRIEGHRMWLINLFTQESAEHIATELIDDKWILKLPDPIAKEVLKGLAEALDNEGIKTDNDFKIQGLLEATKLHLNDMRRLLKLEKKS